MKLFSKNDQTSGSADWLIVGFGNPGPKYEMTRHNAGFLMLDAIAEHFNIEVRRVKFKGLYGKGTIAGQSAVLLKPSTFMNLSGQSVTEAMSFFHIPPERTLIVFDDISERQRPVPAHEDRCRQQARRLGPCGLGTLPLYK